MTFEKLSYIIAATIGLGAILGGVWSIAVATTDLGYRISAMETAIIKVTPAYENLTKSSELLLRDVQNLKRDSLQLIYVDQDRILIRLSTGLLLKIPMERVDEKTMPNDLVRTTPRM